MKRVESFGIIEVDRNSAFQRTAARMSGDENFDQDEQVFPSTNNASNIQGVRRGSYEKNNGKYGSSNFNFG